mgnify:CR=1 FL=1
MDFEGRVDVSVICMVMHEMPSRAHAEMLHSMMAATPEGDVWVVDIDPVYRPSLMMLSGEPYVPDYLKSIEDTFVDVAKSAGRELSTFAIVPGHVRVWIFEHTPRRS